MHPKLNIHGLLALAAQVMEHHTRPETQGKDTVTVQGPLSRIRFIKANLESIRPQVQALLGLLNQEDLNSTSGLHIADFHFLDNGVHEPEAWSTDPKHVNLLVELGLGTGLLEQTWPAGERVPQNANDWRYRYVKKASHGTA